MHESSGQTHSPSVSHWSGTHQAVSWQSTQSQSSGGVASQAHSPSGAPIQPEDPLLLLLLLDEVVVVVVPPPPPPFPPEELVSSSQPAPDARAMVKKANGRA